MPAAYVTPELIFTQTLRRGSKGPGVKRVQEWLCLRESFVQIDGDFGAATEGAVRRFTAGASPEVTPEIFANLSMQMRVALRVPSLLPDLPSQSLAWARQQLSSRPREVGGANRGPWVRLYMDGHDGEQWKWCAGFACWCMTEAALQLGIDVPLIPSFSVDTLVKRAKQTGRFVELPSIAQRGRIPPGSLFVIRGKSLDDWVHIGHAARVNDEHFETIEGNTNDDGSSDGNGVYARSRGYGRADFILLA